MQNGESQTVVHLKRNTDRKLRQSASGFFGERFDHQLMREIRAEPEPLRAARKSVREEQHSGVFEVGLRLSLLQRHDASQTMANPSNTST